MKTLDELKNVVEDFALETKMLSGYVLTDGMDCTPVEVKVHPGENEALFYVESNDEEHVITFIDVTEED